MGQNADMPVHLGRREFLLGTTAVLAAPLVGCTWAGPATVDRLTSGRPFYIAHRGGGRDWPEMTAYAYEQAAALPGLMALEMSVCVSRDGVLVLSHDPTTGRVTGTDHVIADTDWATLSRLTVTAQYTRDRSQPRRPLSRLDDVLPKYLDRFVVFIEPKVAAAAEPLLESLSALGNSHRIVWKHPINSPWFERAKEAGYRTWGYVLDEPAHVGAKLARYAADYRIDMIGAEKSAREDLVHDVAAAAASNGKPAIMWPVNTPEERTRALDHGFAGMMCSDPRGLMSVPA